ncbi:hypothetical protein C8F04DRAFT_1256445 [Mycena alexandri]|uniref:Uncharacterized protein n=1 Tax=Mycena alexandri TaxID=1745969 RepID=A0AAD6T3T9_9AGAR|nr:hypothetical protein C8F04DRAFT_1256445 [Mycena alexandri]
MAITALESQRRNSAVLLETRPCNPPPLPPPPYTQNSVLLDGGNGKASKLCIEARPASPATRRRRHAAADRAFLNLRQGVFVPPLFSRNSRFPSRHLPPPGLRACNLDATEAKVFERGDEVRVRRLNIDGQRSSWSEWQNGQVVKYVPMRVYVGNFGHAYCVQVEREGRLTEQEYVQFMGEICGNDEFDYEEDSLTSEECKKRRHKANYIYTRIPSEKPISGIPQRDVWTPAEVLAWGVHRRIHVRSLAGPTAGELLFVQEALPYTLETAVACRKHNQNVVGPNGRLFLTDMAVEPLVLNNTPPTLFNPPLVIELTPTLHRPILILPSSST